MFFEKSIYEKFRQVKDECYDEICIKQISQ